MLVCVLAWSSAGWHRVSGGPSCRVREVTGCCCGVASDRRTDCRRDDHTLRTIITHDGGCRLGHCWSNADYLTAGLLLGSVILPGLGGI